MKSNSAIFTTILVLGLIVQRATSQIVYTDIPDQKVCAGNCFCGGGNGGGSCNMISEQSLLLDLDNQAGADFKFSATAEFFWGVIGLHLQVIPLNGNGVNANIYLPRALRKNAIVGSASDWSGDSSIFVSLCLSTILGCSEDTISEWVSGKEAYLGVKIIKNNQTHYGWVRLYVSYGSSPSRAYFIIKDYAYETNPDKPIKAGITGSGGGHGHGNSPNSNSDVIPEQNTDADELTVFPNPVQSYTTISFKLEKSETVRLIIYDITGQLIKTVAEKQFDKGVHIQQLDATAINAGIYFLRIQTGSNIQTRKLVIVK